MKILIDENLPRRVQNLLQGDDAHHVVDLGWQSIKNGVLMQLAFDAGFEVFLTADKGIPHQHNLQKIGLAIVVLRIRNTDLESCRRVLREFVFDPSELVPGKVTELSVDG